MYHVFQVEGYVWVRLWSTWSVVSVKNGKAKYWKLYHCISLFISVCHQNDIERPRYMVMMRWTTMPGAIWP